jgi:iron complex transport system substrate-binding protein
MSDPNAAPDPAQRGARTPEPGAHVWGPRRIVCLTEETTEWLYLLGEQARIVGISGYTVRPRRARQEKPRVSAFLSAKIDAILALEPDCVFGFSDLQADIAAALIRHGVQVTVFNQRSVDEIFSMLYQVAAMVGQAEQGLMRIEAMRAGLQAIEAAASPHAPAAARVFRGMGRAAHQRHPLGVGAGRRPSASSACCPR